MLEFAESQRSAFSVRRRKAKRRLTMRLGEVEIDGN